MKLRIDSHTHILPEHMPNWSEKFGYGDFIYLQHHKKGFAKMMRGTQFFREIRENCWNPELRMLEYENFHTQVQVVCTIPVMFSYWAKSKDCLDLSQFLNDHIAGLVSKHPRRYIGLGTVPMQDPELAIAEAARCKQIGLAGLQIGSNINDDNLNEDKFFPFFEACEKMGIALLVHPWNMMGEKKMQRYWLPWLVGMPAETTRAICSMIFGGIFQRLPNLRVNFAHAGGTFFSTFGRIAHGFECRPDLVAIDNDVHPRNYLGKFWVDSVTHDPELLRYVMGIQGSRKITLGSDYPFPLGDLEIGRYIEHMNLTQDQLDDIFYRSACDWLQVSPQSFE
ncbi:MAG: amidohydrolase [Cyclobacteriaceae bacterium]|nr:amidohydrolase [Cyclobacteriaceae bacterium]